MKNIKILFIIFCSILGNIVHSQKQAIDYVNPYIDTHKSRWFYFSSACRPFGMVNLSPDTKVKGSWESGYLYDSTEVLCFSHIHAWQLAGIPVMPSVGIFNGHLGMEATKSSFSHNKEVVKPGYHKIELDRYGIIAKLSSTTRVGFHTYIFPKSDSAYISFHTGEYLAHGSIDSTFIRKKSTYEIEGFSVLAGTPRRPKPTYVYFAAKTNSPFEEFGAWKDKKIIKNVNEINGQNAGAFIRFKTTGEPIQLKVALSYTSIENAWENMRAELNHWNFEKVVDESYENWDTMLSRIRVEGGSEPQKIKFYTDLWHALQGRRIVSDYFGTYCDMTGERAEIRQLPVTENKTPRFPQYNFDALWGSHWTLNVLWSMVYPEIMDGFCNSMVQMYKDGGLIPRGPSGGNYTFVMIGDPAAPFFACAYNKGIRNYDFAKAYMGLRKNAFQGGIRDRAGYEHNDNPKGGGMSYYIKNGYVPEGIQANGVHKDGAAMTLENAYQDWCLAQLAKSMGKDNDYKLFITRSRNYKKLWNPATGYMHPKNIDGTWIENFEPIGQGFQTTGFCESNSAIYSNFVPHDINGLVDLVGGEDKFRERLLNCFTQSAQNKFITDHGKHAMSWIDYENQPSCQMAHLFNYCNAPWLSQKWVRKVKEITFGDISPYGGYNGDEDQGQMGALGVLMAIGLFQMDGGADVNSSYEMTSPIFDKIEIDLNQEYYPGKKFTIETINNSHDNVYIQSVKINSKDWKDFRFPHAIFANGGKIKMILGDKPNKKWGVK